MHRHFQVAEGGRERALSGDGAVPGLRRALPAAVLLLVGPLQGRVAPQVGQAARGHLPPRRAASRHPGKQGRTDGATEDDRIFVRTIDFHKWDTRVESQIIPIYLVEK